MQLENINIELRPRNTWESMDLGLRLYRREWKALTLPLLVFFAPLYILLHFGFIRDADYTLLLIWWLKPLYNRIQLYILSRSVFNETTSVKETFKALPQLILKTGLLTNLTLFRFTRSRSFYLPVWQLENLRGNARRERIKILRGGGSIFPSNSRVFPAFLTAVCIVMELSLFLGFLLLTQIALSGELEASLLNPFSAASDLHGEIVIISVYFLIILIIEPIYLAAGFMIYLNRRTHLEAWDLDLALQKISRRLRGKSPRISRVLVMASIALAFSVSTPTPTIADDSAADEKSQISQSKAKQAIDKILASEEFSRYKTQKQWKYYGDNRQEKDFPNENETINPLSELSNIFASGLRILLWAAMITAIVLLLIYHKQWLPNLQNNYAKKEKAPLPAVMITPKPETQTLPENIPQSAARLAKNGEFRPALSLLYLGAVDVMQQSAALGLKDSNTENDILQLADITLNADNNAYLRRLIELWQTTAYAHQKPNMDDILALCENWHRHFGKEK